MSAGWDDSVMTLGMLFGRLYSSRGVAVLYIDNTCYTHNIPFLLCLNIKLACFTLHASCFMLHIRIKTFCRRIPCVIALNFHELGLALWEPEPAQPPSWLMP